MRGDGVKCSEVFIVSAINIRVLINLKFYKLSTNIAFLGVNIKIIEIKYIIL